MARSRGETPARPETRSITIADSMVLVIGVGVALALPWCNGWVENTPSPHRPYCRNRPGIGGRKPGHHPGGGLAIKLHLGLAAVERPPSVRAARRAGCCCDPRLQCLLSHKWSLRNRDLRDGPGGNRRMRGTEAINSASNPVTRATRNCGMNITTAYIDSDVRSYRSIRARPQSKPTMIW